MKKTLFLLSLLSLSCEETIKDIIWPSDYKVMGMRIHCDPTCPNEEQVEDALFQIAGEWAPHIDFDPTKVWTNYSITFSDRKLFRQDGQQVYGITSHVSHTHWIYYPFECEGYVKGLCPGIFDWELGLSLAHKQLGPDSTELEKLNWRLEHSLYNELANESTQTAKRTVVKPCHPVHSMVYWFPNGEFGINH